jgi:uncharacterized protein YpmB
LIIGCSQFLIETILIIFQALSLSPLLIYQYIQNATTNIQQEHDF